MLERFTEESRRAVRAAVDAAVLEHGERVHTAHLLLGVLSNPSCIAVRVIERRGLAADQVRAAL
ncbi:Clp protease N-terminal domain-containing protein [Frankia sp. Mgl5]|uniref:Clp protease N-terminal domain-containing protein n=1 Tax=Frankia sp. Mgl5 TaxID=2933793 RepID=UPI00200FA877|nr:Clp protease N-terminal domain-containing protein [Frankia sp. Mgl5]MCK9929106.1 Clp protease N-terminal domain-containing protein [Frankia sp. Mgl5]